MTSWGAARRGSADDVIERSGEDQRTDLEVGGHADTTGSQEINKRWRSAGKVQRLLRLLRLLLIKALKLAC